MIRTHPIVGYQLVAVQTAGSMPVAGSVALRRIRWSAGRGRPPQAAARRAGLDVAEKLLTTNIHGANTTAPRPVKRSGIVAS
jgi:hypothetical protein